MDSFNILTQKLRGLKKGCCMHSTATANVSGEYRKFKVSSMSLTLVIISKKIQFHPSTLKLDLLHQPIRQIRGQKRIVLVGPNEGDRTMATNEMKQLNVP